VRQVLSVLEVKSQATSSRHLLDVRFTLKMNLSLTGRLVYIQGRRRGVTGSRQKGHCRSKNGAKQNADNEAGKGCAFSAGQRKLPEPAANAKRIMRAPARFVALKVS
jgi:hypothetical protein